jgi:hypothetical protein
MRYFIPLFVMVLFINGCAQKKPYQYPNYDIIKPKVTCKPNHYNIQALLGYYLDKPYVWAEEGPDAFDCSGLTYNIYGQMGVEIPRIAREQAKIGKTIAFKELHEGDLIFFGSTNRRSRYINHVGIYLGNGWFAHASSKDRKVTVTQFADEPKYLKRMKLCKRILSEDNKKLFMTCDAPLEKMSITDERYTTPWKVGMKLPEKAVPH